MGWASALLVLFGTLGAWNAWRADQLRLRLERTTPEAYFGHDGLFCDGIYTNWLTANVYLVSAVVEEGPPRNIHFVFREYVSNPYGGPNIKALDRFVLIPDRAENDLAQLQHELAARCQNANIALT